MFLELQRTSYEVDTLQEVHSFSSNGYTLFSYGDTNTVWGSVFASGCGTEEDPYRITTELQLRAFAQSLSAEEDYCGQYIRLEKDICLSEEDWIPAGHGEYPFRGQFDGAGHTIGGLRIGMATAPYLDVAGNNAVGYFGLFGVLEEGAVVKNLILQTEVYVTGAQSVYVAGVAGYASHALITQVSVVGTIVGRTVHPNANLFVGGIAGYGHRQEIRNCSAEVHLRAESCNGMAESGGIIGMQNRGSIIACDAYGGITGTAERDKKGGAVFGGIAGVQAGIIQQCCAAMDIIAECYTTYAGALAGWATGISDTMNSYYSLDCLLEVDAFGEAQQKIQPVVPIGWIVEKGKNSIGEAYAGGVVYNVCGVTGEEITNCLSRKETA